MRYLDIKYLIKQSIICLSVVVINNIGHSWNAFELYISRNVVSSVVLPGCGGNVKFTFYGVNSPLQLTIYKFICRPYKAVETGNNTQLNIKQIHLQFKMRE